MDSKPEEAGSVSVPISSLTSGSITPHLLVCRPPNAPRQSMSPNLHHSRPSTSSSSTYVPPIHHSRDHRFTVTVGRGEMDLWQKTLNLEIQLLEEKQRQDEEQELIELSRKQLMGSLLDEKSAQAVVEASKLDAKEKFASADANNDGQVTKDEWKASSEIFDAADLNGDGVLTLNDLQNLVSHAALEAANMDAQVQAATKIQALQRGRAVRMKSRRRPTTSAGRQRISLPLFGKDTNADPTERIATNAKVKIIWVVG